MLEVVDISVAYDGQSVLQGLSFTLDNDELLMLVGPTGCGKTTVLRAIAGLVDLEAGEVRTRDWQATARLNIAPDERRLGMVFQDFALFPHLSVADNVAFKVKNPALADHWIDLLGLADKRQQKPALLSGGEKQRVALARTLAHEPRLVLLDEPLSNLDEALKDELRWVIRDSLKEAGVPAIWVTHDQAEALSVGDRLGVLRGGVLEQLDTAQECFANPATPFVAAFLGEASFVPGHGDSLDAFAETELGVVPISQRLTGALRVLFRPDDLCMESADETNASVRWARYEGTCWLYGAELDSGIHVQLRVNHEERYAVGERVKLIARTGESLAVFPSSERP